MSQEDGGNGLTVEAWEIDLARRIAGTFRRKDEDLTSVLLSRLLDLKANERCDIKNWRGFLVQSLYNAAKNFIRHEDVRRHREWSVDWGESGDEERTVSLATRLAFPEISSRPYFFDIRKQLIPAMRELADVLIDNGGSISAAARFLGRPRKTVEYQITKLRALLRQRGIEP